MDVHSPTNRLPISDSSVFSHEIFSFLTRDSSVPDTGFLCFSHQFAGFSGRKRGHNLIPLTLPGAYWDNENHDSALPPGHQGDTPTESGVVKAGSLLIILSRDLYRGDGDREAWDMPRQSKEQGPVIFCHTSSDWAEGGLSRIVRDRSPNSS